MELANSVVDILSAASRGEDGARARARAVEVANEVRASRGAVTAAVTTRARAREGACARVMTDGDARDRCG